MHLGVGTNLRDGGADDQEPGQVFHGRIMERENPLETHGWRGLDPAQSHLKYTALRHFEFKPYSLGLSSPLQLTPYQ
jgi:hypothetical protein